MKERGLPSKIQGYCFEEFPILLILLYPFLEEQMTERKLRPIFKLIDGDNDGYISDEDVERLCVHVSENDSQKYLNKPKLVFKSI